MIECSDQKLLHWSFLMVQCFMLMLHDIQVKALVVVVVIRFDNLVALPPNSLVVPVCLVR